MSNRPRGVTALVVILLIIAVIGIILGTFGGMMTLYSTSLMSLIILPLSYLYAMLYVDLGLPIGTAFLYVYFILYYFVQLSLNYNQPLYMSVDIFAIIFVATAISLFRMKKWGRYLALALGILLIFGGIIGLIYLVGVIPLVLGIVIVVYLSGDVKYKFE